MTLSLNKRYVLAAAALIAAFVVTGFCVDRHYRSQLAEARDGVKSAHAAFLRAAEAAKAESAWATSLGIIANSQTQRAAEIEAQRLIVTDSANVWRGRYLAAIKTVPDTCKFVTVAASGLVSSVDAVNSLLRTELDTTRASRDAYRASADSARAAFATLAAPASHLDTASTRLLGAAHEPFLSRVAPKPFIGALGGFTANGKPVIAFGVALGWKL